MSEIVITSSVLILVITAVRYLLRGRLPLRMQYALWLLAAARLLAPVTFGNSPVSVLNAVPSQPEQVYIQYTGSTGGAAPDAGPSPAPAPAGTGDARPAVSPGVHFSTQLPAEQDLPANTTVFSLTDSVLRPLWRTGMAAVGGWFLWVNLRFFQRLRAGRRRVELADCPLPVYVSENILSPCLMGLFRPAIYVTPACLEDGERLDHVLAHELTHWRHKDPFWSLVRCLCLTVYWFHPLVWLAAALSRRDCELACDEGALARLGEGERIAYGRTLIGLMAVSASPAHLLETATTMADGKRGLKERLNLIARKPRVLAVTAAAAVLIAAVAAACTFTGAEAESNRPGADNQGDVSTPPAVSGQEPQLSVEPDPTADEFLDLLAKLNAAEQVFAQVQIRVDRGGDQTYLVPADVVAWITAGLGSSYQWTRLPAEAASVPGLDTVDQSFSLTSGDDFTIRFYPDSNRAVYLDSPACVYEAEPVENGQMPVGNWVRAQINEDPETNYRFRTDDGLMYYLLNEADGAYAEGGQYELGERFLARPGTILNTMTWFRGVDAARWPGVDGDAASVLIHALVSEFRVMRGDEDSEAFRAALDQFADEAYGGMAADVRARWNFYPGFTSAPSLPAAEGTSRPPLDDDPSLPTAEEAFRRLLGGDHSLLADGPEERAWVASASMHADQMEYTLLDVDGDGVPELLMQFVQDPASFNAVFDYSGGAVSCWRCDNADGSEFQYVLTDGTMVYETHFNDAVTYRSFRYTPGGGAAELGSLSYTPSGGPSRLNGWPARWAVDGEEVTDQEFDRQLAARITDLRLDAAAWTKLR